jgi:flagellar motor switch protein FliN
METMDKNELVSGILEAFSGALTQALAETGPEEIRLDWSLAPSLLDDSESWTWWSGGLSTHPGANFFVGGPAETWEKFGRGGDSGNAQENALVLISRCFAKAIEEHFGNRAEARDAGPSGAPSADWTRIALKIHYSAGQWPAAVCVLSPEFEQALASGKTGTKTMEPAAAPVHAPAGRTKPSDMLMHVQVPVSVSFGATQIRMKDLLNLSAGSVVELDQALHDNVEVRVNNRVIARGEVVAVDGHYGVRVVELVSGESPGKGIDL